MENLSPACILITGIMASGKSTVAQQLAEQLPKSVHLRGDVFRKMMVNGRVPMEPPLTDEAFAQLKLRYQIAATAARQYCEAGFTVVYQDVIIGDILKDVVAMHRTEFPLSVVVLCPSPEVALQRDSTRHKQTYTGWTPEDLDRALREETPQIGLWLDTTNLSIEETVAMILNRIDEARVIG